LLLAINGKETKRTVEFTVDAVVNTGKSASPVIEPAKKPQFKNMNTKAIIALLIIVAQFTGCSRKSEVGQGQASSGSKVDQSHAARVAKQPPRELILDLGGNSTMKLVLIPAGKFVMGSPESEQLEAAREVAELTGVGLEAARKKYFSDESPQHEVTISQAFYMGIYDVTQEQYEAVMGRNPSSIHYKGAQNPVDSVTWNDAQEFCKKLSVKTGKAVDLPTEAQWEYACRAGTRTPFYTGETITTDQANYDGERIPYGNGVKGIYRETPTRVGSFKPNAFGLYDMHGNVEQWCKDWFWEDYYAISPKSDPPGNEGGDSRVCRGGCWVLAPGDCRSASRGKEAPYIPCAQRGFRVAVAVGAD
jgi:formylglycine-generating enzyme required for sulfatase activity